MGGSGAPMPVSTVSKLHEEIVRFANKNLEACESSHAEVQAIKSCLLTVVTTRWPSASVEMYGSRSTGLYLASSDMDVVLSLIHI